jgi:uncharacterized phage protein (TIGR02218 family)
MADIEIGLGAGLAGELTALAICWQVVRQDGVALGFTTHDRPLLIGGMRYESAPGMAPSAVVSSDGLDIDTMDVAGALSADAITAKDLGLGRYDGAEVRLFMVDWRAPDVGQQPLARGTLGTVEAGTGPDAGFTATLRGLTATLMATRIETYSPECRAELGDWRCRVAMRGRVQRRVVTFSDGEYVLLDGVDAATSGEYVAGRMRVLSGPLAGIERRIIAAEADRLWLDETIALAEGVLVEIREGCDKRFSTCVTRFGNAANFRGEPHVPGGDVLTRFGGL